MNEEIEEWKDIPGYEGIYQASTFGNIKSFKHNKDKLRKLNPNSRGYLQLDLNIKGKRKSFKVHKLIAMTFLNQVPDGTMKEVINHIDGNQLNNNINNLEVVSQQYNANDGMLRNRTSSGITGISWKEDRKKWHSYFPYNGKRVNVGHFNTIEEAILARENYIINLNLQSNDE